MLTGRMLQPRRKRKNWRWKLTAQQCIHISTVECRLLLSSAFRHNTAGPSSDQKPPVNPLVVAGAVCQASITRKYLKGQTPPYRHVQAILLLSVQLKIRFHLHSRDSGIYDLSYNRKILVFLTYKVTTNSESAN